MADPAQDLAARVMQLPSRDRARLAELLISSLDNHPDPDADALWLEEAERRLAELESGQASALSADHVFQESRSKLR